MQKMTPEQIAKELNIITLLCENIAQRIVKIEHKGLFRHNLKHYAKQLKKELDIHLNNMYSVTKDEQEFKEQYEIFKEQDKKLDEFLENLE